MKVVRSWIQELRNLINHKCGQIYQISRGKMRHG